FEFRAALPSTPYLLEALPEDLAYARAELLKLHPGDTLEHTIELQGGGTISGHVVDSSGRPVSGARLTLTYGKGVFGTEGSTVRSADSDDQGVFELRAVTSGELQLQADHDSRLQSSRQALELPPAGVLEGIILKLDDGNSLAGFVRWPDGTPAAGAEIFASFDQAFRAGPTALNAMRGAKARTIADEGGVFVLRGLGKGPFTLRARVDGERRGRARSDGLRPGQEGVEMVLQPSISLKGHVTDQEGEAVRAFTVHLGRVAAGDLMKTTTNNHRQDFIDEDGRFRFDDLEEGLWELQVQGDGLITTVPHEVTLPRPAESPDFEVLLLRSASLSGQVTAPDGQALADAEVFLISGGPAWQQMLDQNPFAPRAVSDEEGNYLLTGIPPGGVSVKARHTEFAPSEARPLDLAAGEVRDGVNLALAMGGIVTGEVINEDGSAGSGRMIMLTHMQTQAVLNSRTDAGGLFRLERVPAGSYQVVALDTQADWSGGDTESGPDISAIMKNMKMGQVSVVNGETVHVVLGSPPEDPVRVYGKVTTNKEPAAGALLSFIPEGDNVYQNLKLTSVDSQGNYELTLDKPGKFVVSVQRIGDGAMQQSTVEFQETIPSGDEYHLNLELPLGRISGTVVDARGKLAAGERITLTVDGVARTDSMLGGQYAEIRTDSAGAFDLKGLRPGVYRLGAGGAAPFSGQGADTLGRISIGGVRIGEDEWKRGLQLELPDPGSIEVTVTNNQGNPLPGATLFVRDAEGRMLEPFSLVKSDGSGKVSYNSIAPGEYTITARVGELTARESAPLTVRAGQTTKSALVLEAGTILWLRIMDGSGDPIAASISVRDEEGREVTGLVGMADLQALYMDGAFSMSEHRLGPLPPGKYRVRAEADGVVAEKPVRLRGGEEKRLTLRLR
ncbi:MAG: protocatechuate 3,4-dioxygenase beta subunit, partial [Planctomycetota bacterium]